MKDKFLKITSAVLLLVSFLSFGFGKMENPELLFYAVISAALCLPLAFKAAKRAGNSKIFYTILIVGSFFFVVSLINYAIFMVDHYGDSNGIVATIFLLCLSVIVVGLLFLAIPDEGWRANSKLFNRMRYLRLPLFHLFYVFLVLIVIISAGLTYFGNYHLEILLVVSTCFQIIAAFIIEPLNPSKPYKIFNIIMAIFSIGIFFCYFYRLVEISIGEEINIIKAAFLTLITLFVLVGFLNFVQERWFKDVAYKIRHGS